MTNISVEKRNNPSIAVVGEYFYLRVTEQRLAKLRENTPEEAIRRKLLEKVRCLPECKSIPEGAFDDEGPAIVERALSYRGWAEPPTPSGGDGA